MERPGGPTAPKDCMAKSISHLSIRGISAPIAADEIERRMDG